MNSTHPSPKFSHPAEMSLAHAFKTIGNGMPFLFAKALGEAVALALSANCQFR